MKPGRAGGARTRHSTIRCSCSPTTPRASIEMKGGTIVPFRHRRHRGRARARLRGGRWRRRPARRRRRHRPAVPARRPARRDAPGGRSDSSGGRRAALRARRRRAGRLPLHRVRGLGRGRARVLREGRAARLRGATLTLRCRSRRSSSRRRCWCRTTGARPVPGKRPSSRPTPATPSRTCARGASACARAGGRSSWWRARS